MVNPEKTNMPVGKKRTKTPAAPAEVLLMEDISSAFRHATRIGSNLRSATPEIRQKYGKLMSSLGALAELAGEICGADLTAD